MWNMAISLLLFVGLCVAAPHPPSGRIIGGQNASISDYPYALQLEYHEGVHDLICGAVLIAPRWAITACHCLYNRDMEYFVRAGATDLGSGGTVYTVTNTVWHPNFRWHDDDYDAALLYLNDTVSDPDAAVIEMAPEGTPIPEGKNMTVVGWGYQDGNGNFPTVLQALEYPILDNDTCTRRMTAISNYTESMFCAGYMEGGKGFCWADNGGPAVYDGILIGISSWVNYCATADTPSGFTNIAFIRSWIDSVISG
ncbi:hypothetical protein NQ318_020821 [Aromia moschata]|uniref:Peptidase S1 domain-containing protein n=1 Tax=Aromia moschata TaxID=1265417 RepID=A0AAV8Y5N3_9CUCU|nr:hypothetical protein NQ318_020821 [Aromia moschata]